MSDSERSASSRREVLASGRIIGSFVVKEYIGHGGYSDIYVVTEPKERKDYVIKLEEVGQKKTAILREMEILDDLTDSKYFPIIKKKGSTEKYHYIAMEVLGPSLSQLKKILPSESYSVETTIRLSRYMLAAIQAVHEKGYIHRDIKPANFLIRCDSTNPVCLIDFGLSRKYLDENGRHVPCRTKNNSVAGTSKYMTVHAHEKLDLSRRDDLESWFYSVLELIDGKLPWSDLKDRTEIELMKKRITTTQLCSSLPEEYKEIYQYIKGLEFEETPDYKRMLNLINLAIAKAHCEESPYEWFVLPPEKISKVSKIGLKPNQIKRYGYLSSEQVHAPIYKMHGADENLIPPKIKKDKPAGEDFDPGVPQHNIEEYRKPPVPSPFANSREVGMLPEVPQETYVGNVDESDDYDSEEEDGKCRI